jgi:outer membrane protein assembly factor BamB
MESGAIIDEEGTIYFGDFDRDLYAVYPNGTVKWEKRLDGWVWSTPTIADDGTIYVGTYGDRLYAINPNGTTKWRYMSYGSISSSPAIGEDGTIYFGNMGFPDDGGCRIFAINPDGSEKWHYQTEWKIISNPAIADDGTIYIGSGDSYLYAMNPNGTLKWRFNTGGEIHSHPSIAEDGTIYITSFDNYVYAINTNGTLKWKVKGVGSGTTTPVLLKDGSILISGSKLRALNPNNGSENWYYDTGEDNIIHNSNPAIDSNGFIYFGIIINMDDGGELVALHQNGWKKWSSGIICSNWISSSPCIDSNGTVYIGLSNNLDADIVGGFSAFGELHFDAPDTPLITGKVEGNYKDIQYFNFTSIDPNGDNVYFNIEWGDGKKKYLVGPYSSGEKIIISHTYEEIGNYTIRARAKNENNLWSEWSTLEVSMPKTKGIYDVLLDRFPLLGWLFNQMLG